METYNSVIIKIVNGVVPEAPPRLPRHSRASQRQGESPRHSRMNKYGIFYSILDGCIIEIGAAG